MCDDGSVHSSAPVATAPEQCEPDRARATQHGRQQTTKMEAAARERRPGPSSACNFRRAMRLEAGGLQRSGKASALAGPNVRHERRD